MLNRLLYEYYKSPNNGRQLASLQDGRRVLLVHSEMSGPSTLRLLLARHDAPREITDFEDLGTLTGPKSIPDDAGPWGSGGSLVIVDDTLHAAWTGPHGIQYVRATWTGKRFRWGRVRQILEGDYWLGDLFSIGTHVALTYHRVHDRQTESVGVGRLDRKWQFTEVHRGTPMFAPVADVDQRGHLHLSWSDTAEQLYYARLDRAGAKPHVELLGPGGQPTILATGEQVLVACVSGYAYGPLRYYVRDRRKWHRDAPLTVTSPWLTSDLLHSPGLTLDRHGVPWLIFANSTRRSTFWTRWLGDNWSPLTNGPRIFYRPGHFDFNLLPIGRLSVEKRSISNVADPASASASTKGEPPVAGGPPPDIGLLLTCEPPIDKVEFRRAAVPDLPTTGPRKVLFLDLLEVASTKNVRLQVETAVKHPENPLMETGPVGSFDEDRVFNHGTVLFDGGKYRMWYGAIREPRRGEPRPPWWDWIRCGYAESNDGIHWKRVRVGLVEWHGSLENNIVPFLRHAPVMIRDEHDPDPKRRYKSFVFWTSGEHIEIARSGKYGKQFDPRDELFLMDLFTSADGIHFEQHAGEVRFPGEQAKPLSTIPNSVFRDDLETDPARRFKGYGFLSLNLRRRGTSLVVSPDAQHWTAHPEMPLLDPAVRGTPPAVGGPTGQVHDTVCFPYEGYYLALYQDQHDPGNMPIELAVSRDAETFQHVLPGSKVIPVGGPDDFDAQTILPSTPIILEHEIRLYYGGGSVRRPPLKGRPKDVAQPGLATLRRDGFTSISLSDPRQAGSLVTIPFRLPQHLSSLQVNANCQPRSRLRAELIDHATGKPLPGCSLADCQPITGNQFDHTVSWNPTGTLPRTTGLVQLRWELQAAATSPKLHAFWFRPHR